MIAERSFFRTYGARAGLPAPALLGLLPGTGCAAQAVPDWAYEAVEQLEAAGYVDLAGKTPQEYSRKDLVDLVARGLHEIDRVQQGTAADEYGRLVSLAMRDEVRVKLYREQERQLRRSLADAEAAAKHAEERLARESLRGTNRLEIMKPLAEKASEARQRLQFTARDYALTKMRLEKRELALANLKERKREVLAHLTGGENLQPTGTAAAAPVSAAPVAVAETPADAYAEPLVAQDAMDAATRLRALFIEDLARIGYTDEENGDQQLYAPVLLPEKSEPRLKIDAEARADTSRSTGVESGPNLTRLRLRVYPDYDIDGNWHALGMFEYTKFLNGGSNDGKLRFDRYYLTGKIGLVETGIGIFGTAFAEGNIYDSKFKGVRLSIGSPVRYTLYHGTIDKADDVTALHASYDTPAYGIDAGMYRFDKINDAARNIYMGNFRIPLDKFDFGAMLLHGRDHAAGNGTGYVLTLATSGSTWRPGSLAYWFKYYRQPSATYVSHTMHGMADYMSYDSTSIGPRRGGFQGWGTGLNYTVQKDLMFALEYYDIRDLDTSRRSRTVWAALTGYFRNYEI